jgi:mRNA interferase HigB
MRVHVIKAKTVREFALNHASSIRSFEQWIDMIRYADWETPDDIKQTFASADILGRGSNRVVFNVQGNHFRIICKYQFGETMVHLFVTWIGTHSEYTELCKKGKQYTIEQY